jgi:hypothetical protein
MTKSARYSLLTAKNGDGLTVKQPFAGRLFKAQNTGNWVGDDNEDLTFVLTKAVFETGSVTINAKSLAIPDGGLEYNRFRLLSTAAEFGDAAGVSYKIQTTAAGTRDKSDIQEVKPGQNAELTGRQVATEAGDVNLQIEITTKSKDISPMLDNQLLAAQVFKTNITDYTQAISDSELKPSNGSAQAMYISKPVALASGFDSTGLEVKIDVARQVGTDVEVFCRVLARDDNTVSNGISDKYWIKMPLVTPSEKTFCGTDVIYSTETYRLLEPRLGYKVASSSAKYETFAYYQVKVVFYSNNPLYEILLVNDMYKVESGLLRLKNLPATTGPEITEAISIQVQPTYSTRFSLTGIYASKRAISYDYYRRSALLPHPIKHPLSSCQIFLNLFS